MRGGVGPTRGPDRYTPSTAVAPGCRRSAKSPVTPHGHGDAVTGSAPDQVKDPTPVSPGKPDMVPVAVSATVRGKRADLTRYAVIPGRSTAAWSLSGTTTVDVVPNGRPAKRRSIMTLDHRDWFITITQADCRVLAVDTGDAVEIRLRPAPADLPEELEALLAAGPSARAVWGGLSDSRKRMLRDTVAGAKQAEPRRRRARKALIDDHSV